MGRSTHLAFIHCKTKLATHLCLGVKWKTEESSMLVNSAPKPKNLLMSLFAGLFKAGGGKASSLFDSGSAFFSSALAGKGAEKPAVSLKAVIKTGSTKHAPAEAHANAEAEPTKERKKERRPPIQPEVPARAGRGAAADMSQRRGEERKKKLKKEKPAAAAAEAAAAASEPRDAAKQSKLQAVSEAVVAANAAAKPSQSGKRRQAADVDSEDEEAPAKKRKLSRREKARKSLAGLPASPAEGDEAAQLAHETSSARPSLADESNGEVAVVKKVGPL